MKSSLLGASLLAAARVLAFDADTIGFYPFEGATPGASAVGQTVVNKVQADQFAGSVTLTSGATNPFAVFDEDAPGKYVYAGNCGEPLCENPRSVSVGSYATSGGAGGSLTIADIGTELSKHHATGNTVEYFFKMASTTEKRWSKNVASVLIHGGYIGVAGTAQPLQVYAPNGDSWSENVISVGAKGSTATNPYRRDFNFSGVGDGKWHHVAIVETSDQKVYVYYDYKLVNKNSEAMTMAGVTELTESNPFVFFNDARQGKVSCLRFTTRALDSDEFMRASDTPFVPAGQDAFAFYPFEDATPGESAVGQTVVNKVRGDLFSGSVSLTSGATNPFAKFDEDAPGKYIYAGNSGDPLCENPRSISVGSDATATGAGGSLTISDIGTEISRHHATGNTVEYFFKLASQSERRYSAGGSSVYVYGGYLGMSGAAQPLRIYAPNTASSWSEGVISVGAKDSNNYRQAIAFGGVNSGWHHVAIVEKSDQTVEVYYDYKLAMSAALTMYGTEKRTDSLPFIFFNNNLQGKVSCLRFSSRALGKDEFLKASNTLPAYAGDDAFAFYPFEGVTSGASAVGDTVVNKVRGDIGPGKVTLTSGAINPFAKFDEDAPGTVICDGLRNVVLSENPRSISVGSDATSGGAGGSLTIADIGTELSKHHATGNTVEYFFKMASTTEKRYAQGAASVLVHGGYLGTSAAAQPLQLYAPNGSSWSENVISVGAKGSGGSNPYRKDFKFNGVNDDGWHHVAIVEKTDHTVEIYYDYKQVMNNGEPLTMAGVTELTESKPFVFFNDSLQGKVSCLRFSSRALETSQFLRAYSRKVDGIVQPDVAAFYTFKDGATGSSAVGVTLLNDVDMTAPGSASLGSGSGAAVTFDDDCPGAAIYGGEDYPQAPFALNPQSVSLSSASTGAAGSLSFPGLGQVFYAAHKTGFTFECFFKMLDDNMTQYEASYRLYAGYLSGADVKPFSLILPNSKAGNTCHYGLSDQSANLSSSVFDGKWHHLALVETPVVDDSQVPAVTNWTVTTWVDRVRIGAPTVVSAIVDSPDKVEANGLELGRNKIHAKFSCVKVTTRPLGRKEFMRTRPRSMGTSIIIR